MKTFGARTAASEPGTVGSPKIAAKDGPEVMLLLKIVPAGNVVAWIAAAFVVRSLSAALALAALLSDNQMIPTSSVCKCPLVEYGPPPFVCFGLANVMASTSLTTGLPEAARMSPGSVT